MKTCYKMLTKSFLMVYRASGPNAIPERKPREKTLEWRLLKNKQCEKVILPQDSNLQPLDYGYTALPLEK